MLLHKMIKASVIFQKKVTSIDFSVNFIEDESKEGRGIPEEGSVMTPQNGTTIDLTTTTASDTISVDNADNKYFKLEH